MKALGEASGLSGLDVADVEDRHHVRVGRHASRGTGLALESPDSELVVREAVARAP